MDFLFLLVSGGMGPQHRPMQGFLFLILHAVSLAVNKRSRWHFALYYIPVWAVTLWIWWQWDFHCVWQRGAQTRLLLKLANLWRHLAE